MLIKCRRQLAGKRAMLIKATDVNNRRYNSDEVTQCHPRRAIA